MIFFMQRPEFASRRAIPHTDPILWTTVVNVYREVRTSVVQLNDMIATKMSQYSLEVELVLLLSTPRVAL
jgi:hypothetical protein